MATGDQSDMESRIRATLVPSWFGGTSPIVDAIVKGAAYLLAFAYSMFAYAKLQTRIKTATDIWLDLISNDFLGSRLPRRANELDDPYRQRIMARILRETTTRKGMHDALTTLTGREPVIFEPRKPADTGSYGAGAGYNVGGGYGSMKMPYQALIIALRPLGSGVPTVTGYGKAAGGYGTASRFEYASLDMVQSAVSDQDIYSLVDEVKPAGTTCWVRVSAYGRPRIDYLGTTFVLGESVIL